MNDPRAISLSYPPFGTFEFRIGGSLPLDPRVDIEEADFQRLRKPRAGCVIALVYTPHAPHDLKDYL